MKKILVILGPTATGKSDLAVKLAKKFKGEVISADSRQVYEGLDIGTGKITKKEMGGVPHHLLDVADPKKQFSVVKYVRHAEEIIEDIIHRNKLPIICGGTGFYIQALVDGIILPEVPPNPELRKKLSKKTSSELMKILKKLDPKRASGIDSHNSRRIIRAIEIAGVLGKVPPIRKILKYDPLFIGLDLPAEDLRKKIKIRLEKRLKKGMLEEARKLHKDGLSWKRMNELGLEYRYLALYLQKKITLDEMNKKLETEIWHYAKRQMTWFKKDKRIKWFDPDHIGKIEKEARKFFNK
ncbi:MAG: tRNA (adenosine(37)-N6)-dimethylallyltransferase MiaA [bacterium]|nr:tRNA (adenosine(37)-N6)-dimethylallyltransferase MiaA [bacterium]